MITENNLIVFVLDDSRLIGTLIADYLRTHFTAATIIHGDNAADLAVGTADAHPHVILVNMDVISRNIPECIFQLRNRYHEQIHILVYSTQSFPMFKYKQAIQEGVTGIVSFDECSSDFTQAVNGLLKQGCYVSSSLQKQWMDCIANRSDLEKQPIDLLSDREREVYRMIGQGKSIKEIADFLSITHKTVHTYRERIKAKLNIPDSQSLLLQAVSDTINGMDQ